VSEDHSADRSLTSRLFGWARGSATAHDEGGRDAGPPVGTKVLGRFIKALSSRPSPSLLDLGPVVGPNVAFFGEELGCRLQVEDLYADLDRLSAASALDTLPAHLATRLTHPPESFDGILCWDVFDYLDKPSAQVLAGELVARLKPGGVLMAFFQTQANAAPTYTKYVILDAGQLQYRTYPAAHGRRTIFQNRDIDRLFTGLSVSDSFLMLNRTREMLLRKRVPPATPAS
jgi:hypothetical protein